MAGTDKVTRILTMYARLIEGRKINKQSYCMDMNIDRRTFDRDIEDIRLFLSETFSNDELIYDWKNESYHLKNTYQKQKLSGMEITYILESLRESQGLRKDEYIVIVSSILRACERNKYPLLKTISDRYIVTYQNQQVQQAVMKMQWDLQQCIAEYDIIQLKLKDESKVTVSPVDLRLCKGIFYLFTYVNSEELEVYAVTDIESFQMQYCKFERRLVEKYNRISEMEIKERMEKERKRTHEKY